MFTEEEKIRAIELYFKYGKKLAPVVRELGYPSKRNLRRWIRSWEAGGGVKGVSLDIENYCTLRLFFDLSTLAGLSRRNLPEAGIRLLFQI